MAKGLSPTTIRISGYSGANSSCLLYTSDAADD